MKVVGPVGDWAVTVQAASPVDQAAALTLWPNRMWGSIPSSRAVSRT